MDPKITPAELSALAATLSTAVAAAKGAPFIPTALREGLAVAAEFAEAAGEHIASLTGQAEALRAEAEAQAAVIFKLNAEAEATALELKMLKEGSGDLLLSLDARIDALEAAAQPVAP